MKKLTFLLIVILFTSAAIAQQKSYSVRDFSDLYYAKLTVNDDAAAITIYSKQTKKKLLTHELNAGIDVDYYLTEDGKVDVNVQEIPYGMQSMLIFDDFNFDGENDLALLDGHYSCYGGPSFNIYLANGKGGFALDEEFSALAHDYCGMFSYDAESKTISTMTKSGCCWHEFSDFKVTNGKLFAVKITEEQASMLLPYFDYKESSWNGKRMVERSYSMVNNDFLDDIALFSFQLDKNGKRITLFPLEFQDTTFLLYTFYTPSGLVEFTYPIFPYLDSESEDDYEYFDLKKVTNGYELHFKNASAAYTIYDYPKRGGKPAELGIRVQTKGKVYDMPAKLSSKKASLQMLAGKDYANLYKD